MANKYKTLGSGSMKLPKLIDRGGGGQRPMPAVMPSTEIQKRLRKLEKSAGGTDALVKRVGDQYEYVDDYIYTAYASALSNLSSGGKITNQSDATGFQFSPYNTSGVLLAYRGFFVNRSIHQSGDPTDYTWESTSGQSGYTSSERHYTTSTGLVEALGNPTEPGSGVTWTVVNSGTAIPSNAVWVAERYTLAGVPSAWDIYPVDAYISSGQLVDASVIAAKIADNAVTTAKILDDAIDADKIANNAVTTAAILADAIDATKIADNAVVTNAIAADAITANKILAGEIGANHIAANSLTAGQIATNAITADEIQAGAIGVSELAADSVTANAIAANSVTASEIAAGTITASEIAADAITANAIATNAVTADAINAGTITADEIASNAITSAKVNADAITVDKIDLDGTLSVTADSGAIRWGKDDGDDVSNSGLFIGRNSSGSPRFVIGSPSSFIYFNGTTGVVSAIGVSSSATTGEEENFFTDTSSTHTLNLSPLVDEINIQMVGGGGGGGRNGTSDASRYDDGYPNVPSSTDGGDTIVKVVRSDGTVRATYTAAGGIDGSSCAHGAGCAYNGSSSPGEDGEDFTHPGSGAHSSFAGTGGTGGASNTNNAGGDGGTGAGGGGQGQAGGGSAADGGGGGEAGTFYTTTLLKTSAHYVSTDHLEITVGAGGTGSYITGYNYTRVGGNGGNGRVRIKGEDT